MAWELGDWMSVLDGAVKVAGLGSSVYGYRGTVEMRNGVGPNIDRTNIGPA